jgi:hypothetical protein
MDWHDWLLELGERAAMYLALSASSRQYFGRDNNRIVWQDK